MSAAYNVLKVKDWLNTTDVEVLVKRCKSIASDLIIKYAPPDSELATQSFYAHDCVSYMIERSFKHNRFDELFLRVVAKRYLFSKV